MATVQIECTCETCNHQWFYLPFEEMRMVMADVLRIRTRELNWRERQKYFGGASTRGFGFCPGCRLPGCCLFACCRPRFFPGCWISLAFMAGPLSQWMHTFIQMYQIKQMPTLYRSCPQCDSGMFKKVVAVYDDEGKTRREESVSWQLPVINPIHIATHASIHL